VITRRIAAIVVACAATGGVIGGVIGKSIFDVPAHPCPPPSIMEKGEVKVLAYPGVLWDHYYTCRGP